MSRVPVAMQALDTVAKDTVAMYTVAMYTDELCPFCFSGTAERTFIKAVKSRARLPIGCFSLQCHSDPVHRFQEGHLS